MADDTDKPLDTQVNALAGILPQAELGLVGPTVEDDISRAIARYGANAVKAAVKDATKRKVGRKPDMDWKKVRHIIETDAKLWLEGGDPFADRKNYSIAKYYADNYAGHSHPATMKMVQRALKKNRMWITLANAERHPRDGYPFTANLRAAEALRDCWPGGEGRSYFLDRALGLIAKFELAHGHPPPDEMSINEVEVKSKEATKPQRKPVAGLLSQYLDTKP